MSRSKYNFVFSKMIYYFLKIPTKSIAEDTRGNKLYTFNTIC